MLPVLEDTRLAQRWSEGHISIDALLSYSRFAARALTPFPARRHHREQLSLIIGDMASLAFKWRKPLSARLLRCLAGVGRDDGVRRPVPGECEAAVAGR